MVSCGAHAPKLPVQPRPLQNCLSPKGLKGELPSWTKAADCKSAGLTFGGSNPSSPKIFNLHLSVLRCFRV